MLALGFVFVAGSAQASLVGGRYFLSTDSDGNDVHRQTLYGWHPLSDGLDIGASLERTDFRAGGRYTYRVAAQYDVRSGSYASRGDIGSERLGSRHFITGDVVVDHYLGDWVLSVGADRVLVDSERGLAAGLTATTAHASADWSTAHRGVAVIVGRTAFSDDNVRPRVRARLWQSICDDCGIAIHLSGDHYSNSSPHTGYYFSPRRYTRAMAGANLRRAIPAGVFGARAEYGFQRVDGEQHPSHVLRLSFESRPLAKYWFWRIDITRDQKQPDFTYTEGLLTLFRRF